LGLGALATPLVGIGGAVSGLPMAIVIAVSSASALAVFAAVAVRTRTLTPVLDTPEEAAADMPSASRAEVDVASTGQSPIIRIRTGFSLMMPLVR
jgi:hypothetical protein